MSGRDVVLKPDPIGTRNDSPLELVLPAPRLGGVDTQTAPMVLRGIAIEARHVGNNKGAGVRPAAGQVGPHYIVEVVDIHVLVHNDAAFVVIQMSAKRRHQNLARVALILGTDFDDSIE